MPSRLPLAARTPTTGVPTAGVPAAAATCRLLTGALFEFGDGIRDPLVHRVQFALVGFPLGPEPGRLSRHEGLATVFNGA